MKEEEAFERAASSPPADGEEEGDAGTGGAFNPETGEINWDCPCLGGMAYGPCGEQFREAFSCFVFSEDEPKGINCVEKFKAMQDCFRAHPETYGEGMSCIPLWRSGIVSVLFPCSRALFLMMYLTAQLTQKF